MDKITESTFTLDPFAPFNGIVFEAFDPEVFFETDPTFIDEIISEAAEVKKKNIFERLISIIKKALKWIGKTIRNVITGIRKLVNGKAKTVDQVAGAAGLKKHTILRTPVDPTDPDNPKKAADSVYMNFIEGITEDGILLKPSVLVKVDVDSVPIKGKAIHAGGARASQVLDLITNPKALDKYMEFFKKLTNELSLKNLTAADMDKIYRMCKSFAGRPTALDYVKGEVSGGVESRHEHMRITVNELIDMQKRVDEMSELCEKVDDCKRNLSINLGTNSKEVEEMYLDMLNKLSWACVNLQGGLHAISNGLKGIYQLDPGYWGCITDISMLSKFTAECIKTGIPAKYIVNNIYKACDKSIKGSPNVDKPLMGFGRLTLLPPGENVYKVAFNQYGIRSNKNDFTVMEAIGVTELRSKFAITSSSTKGNIVNVMEKVDANSKPSLAEATKLGEEINEGLKKLNTGFSIYDIKPDAFGKKNGKYVILDYGYLHRTGFKGNKG